ncbi:hypothetical protein [uncultured Litoreibacter sp.]|uniref:hypothetical protein n=1 Tax=uncultured Litoreibacter sp. TaxID=1392394 RepID=UPI0026061CF4|nr:hypothetical protein [uncultured Litoreibacter sp.]
MKYPLIALLLVAGCSNIVPSAIARLYSVSPMEADPSDIAVALDLPDGIGVRQGTAKLLLTATRSDTNETSAATYILAASPGRDGSTVYAIADRDFGRLRAQQSLIRGWKDAAGDATNGSLSAGLEGCIIGAGPADDAAMSINMRTAKEDAFFPLIRRAPITDVMELADMEDLKPCD